MPLSLTQTTLVRIVAGQAITNNLLRLLALSPSVSISGSVATADLADGAVTPAKATPGAYFYAADTTNTNAYVATYAPAVGAYANGLAVLLKITNANTGAAVPSLNANGLGVKNIFHRNGQTPKAGDLPANSILHLVYNTSLDSGSGGFHVQNVLPSQDIRFGTGGGTANAQTFTTNNMPTVNALSGLAGQLIVYKVTVANTAAATLAVDGLAATNIRKRNGVAVQTGDLPLGDYVFLTYDTTDGVFYLLNRANDAAIVASCRNLIIQSTSTTQATVAADEVVLRGCTSAGVAAGLPLVVQSVSLTLDVSAGVALNGLETGATRTLSTWYYIWLISDGTNVRGVLETAGAGDGAAPGGPDLSGGAFAGYNYAALVGQLRLNATGLGEIVPFVQFDRDVGLSSTTILTAKAPAGNDTFEILAGADLTAFRAAVPPTARFFSGVCGSDNTTDAAFWALAAAASDGTLATNILGLQLAHIGAAGTTADGIAAGANYSNVPVRGAASRNIQWKSVLTTVTVTLIVSGYKF